MKLLQKHGEMACWAGAWFVLLAMLFALAFGCATGPGYPAPEGVPNLDQVEPGVYRGGQPRTAAGWRYLRSLGLTNDIKLNTGEEASDSAAVSAGFTLRYFPIDTIEQLVTGPDSIQMDSALAAIGPGTFIHCEHGQDRTGLLVGLYRLQEGTNAAAAWCEMTNHGYHPALMGLTWYWRERVEWGLRSNIQQPTPNIQHPAGNSP